MVAKAGVARVALTKFGLGALGVGAAIAGLLTLAHDANALTVTFTQNDLDYTLTTLPTSSTNPTPASYSGNNTVLFGVTNEIPDVYRSPFENVNSSPGATALTDGGFGIGNWASLPYTSVQGGGTATYNFAPSNMLSILWGSPDSYNTLTFYSGQNGGGNALYTLTGSALELQTYGHDLVDFTMTGGYFQSVVLTSSVNAFEFADLQAGLLTTIQGTPVPAALPLFASGIGLAGLFGWRRKAKTKAAAATIG
jgi:hypothetical protein